MTEDLGKKIRELFSTPTLIKNFRYFYKTENEYKLFFKDIRVMAFLNNKDLRNTIDTFFANELKITKTAKATYTHRNTLKYRLEKIKKITSLDIKKLNDAILLKNLLDVYNNRSL